MSLVESLGWDERVATLFTAIEEPEAVPARVTRVDRGLCIVTTDEGPQRATWLGVRSRQAGVAEYPAVGDWVAVVDDPNEGCAVVGILPRRSALKRRAPEDRERAEQVLAANVDVMAVVSALDRPVSEGRTERLLAMAWDGGARPVVVLTKADVADEAAVGAAVEATGRVALGVDVIVTSATDGRGIDELADLARPANTLALIGPSGAGKSSLANRILGGEVQRVGAVREGDARGRHTTVTRDLIPIPGGGVLLDTPGLRSLALLDAEGGLAAAFADIEALAEGCKFRDCAHGSEPGCAVRAAIDAGGLEDRRLTSYRKLQRELAERPPRHVEHAASRSFGRQIKQMMKAKPKKR